MNLIQRRDRPGRKLSSVSAALASTLLLVVWTTAFSTRAIPSAQASANLQAFVGTWQAKFDGKVFQIVILELKNGKLTGSVSRGHIELNDEGVMTAAELKEGSDPIIDSRLEGKVLHLTTSDQTEKSEKINFDLTLTGTDEATIIPVDDEIQKEMPNFKPWKVERVRK